MRFFLLRDAPDRNIGESRGQAVLRNRPGQCCQIVNYLLKVAFMGIRASVGIKGLNVEFIYLRQQLTSNQWEHLAATMEEMRK
jgi:hypothetical protein